jgi:hypothetical protein
MVNVHSQLEVLERRVQDGDDEIHVHPIAIIEILDTEGVQNITQDERDMQNRYLTAPEKDIVPTFWEPRQWDSAATRLTESESNMWREQLREFTPGRMAISIIHKREKSVTIQRRQKKLPTVNSSPSITRFLQTDFDDEADPAVTTTKDTTGSSHAWRGHRIVPSSARRMSTRSNGSVAIPSADALMLYLPTQVFGTDTSDCETDQEIF